MSPALTTGVGAGGCAVGDGLASVGAGLAVASPLGRQWALRSASRLRRAVAVAGTCVGSSVAVAFAAAGRGVLVGVGVAAGASDPQAAKVAPGQQDEDDQQQGPGGLIGQTRSVHGLVSPLRFEVLLWHPLQDAVAGRSMMPKAASSEPGCDLL